MNLHSAERDEIERIDYFLDQLARAVERGEVPRPSYDLLAPRYLARREDLVVILSGAYQPPAPAVVAPGAYLPVPTAVPEGHAAAWAPARSPQPPPVSRKPVRERKPVSWTTVLLFLGAFLVIVASAIFAVAVWNTTGPLFKLGFLGALTAAFYAAGHFARTKLELKTGGAALTVVGSSMLLFDCWIVISGYQLAGPMPWAVALFFCSAVYWYTEVRLGDRFYGIAGAAAQIGWWWLMAAGLNFERPIRFAGLAVIALAWQLVAERAEESDTFGALATVLLWSAPLLSVGAAVGIAGDALLVGTSTWTVLGCAVIVSACLAVVVFRTRLIEASQRAWIAGLGQVPLFIVVLLPAESSWLGVGFLAAAAAVYALTAFSVGGTPFALAAAGMELLAVLGALDVLKASDSVQVGVLAGLAVTWVVASLLADKLAEDPAAGRWRGAGATAGVIEGAGIALLVAVSVATPAVSRNVPLAGFRTGADDVVLAAVVLSAWALASIVRRRPAVAVATSFWSFYVLAALVAWSLPKVHSAVYGMTLVALAGAWLFARGAMRRFYRIDEMLFGWAMRGLALAIFVGALGAEALFFKTAATWQGVALATLVAVLFGADAELGGSRLSAAIGGGVLVIAGYFAGVIVGDSDSGGALAGACVGLALALLGGGLRSLRPRYAELLALAGAGAATIACFVGASGWGLAGALGIVALAWAGTSYAAREEWLLLLAGLSAFAACAAALAAANPAPVVTVILLSAAGIALGAVALLPATGPDGPHSHTGASLAIAGLVGLIGFAIAGRMPPGVHEWFWSATRWIAIGEHGEAVVLLVLGTYVVAQAEWWRFELATYVGYAVILLALFFELHALEFTTVELYSTSLAIYLAAMGVLYARRAPERSIPRTMDFAVTLVGLGVPAVNALSTSGPDSLVHVAWTVGLSLVAIGAGVTLRVRAYFLGGVAAMAVVVGWKWLTYLAQVWWLLLGLIGTAMLIIALTWERQRAVLSDTRRQLEDRLETWR